jgi:hypothetical protein
MARAKASTFSVRGVRSGLYKSAKFLGDVSSITNQRIGKRIGQRIVGKQTGKALRIFN